MSKGVEEDENLSYHTAAAALYRGITAVAGLGYIGLGVRIPIPEWGRMLSESQQYMRTDLHLLLIPGLFILITATAFNLLGDGIRDATDPRLRGYVKPKKTPFWKRRAK